MAYRLFVLVLLLLLNLPALAHHGSNISYQLDKTITLEGVATEWDYRNPHPQIYFDVKDKQGAVEHWATELLPTPLMLKNMNVGWGDGSNNGLISVEYLFKGESAHAAVAPWRGKSALDAAALMDVGWNYRREHLRL